jgi:plasmid stabilization system protein ParE
MFARKVLTGIVGIHDDIGRRQAFARQVVIGDQDLHAARARCTYTRMTGDAIVHGDQKIGAVWRNFRHQGGAQTVAVTQSIRNQKVHMARAEQAQPAHRKRRAAIACCKSVLAAASAGQDCGGIKPARRRSNCSTSVTPRAARTRRITGCRAACRSTAQSGTARF